MLKFFVALQTRFVELRDSEKGQAYVEYGVLLALVAIALIVTLGFFADDIESAFNKIGNTVSGL
jgi:Flp pilus assembly pilin Flp